MNLSFAGCGFLGVYHLGVAAGLSKSAPRFLKSIEAFAGASAGSLIAAALATSVPLEQCSHFVQDLAKEARKKPLGPINPEFDLIGYLRGGLEKFLPHDGHEMATGRLYVSVTRLKDNRNVLLSQYDSREFLIETLLASCFIPIYAGLKFPQFDGQKWYDGGFTDNLPRPPHGKTILVSPFSGDSDICPEDSSRVMAEFKWRNMSVSLNKDNAMRTQHILYPPNQQAFDKLYQAGYKDAVNYVTTKGLS
ncbi:predicted protein [Nematostella vectensis]|uniref:PNPLA domain-containing protein n=1 Tax=Nematostella vectensis TaxID=45351 RepID=A7SQ61_NEMVE|nr:patatin-like phospholipase domain-containing protein 4 [Nematostella vectensis]EDO34170.1 predicted protein [Nematostella vectensis]|eukprot:XP_001626270.1 predicted protein [Nematostella vectensis]